MRLRLAAVQRRHLVAVATQLAREPLSTVLGAREYQRAALGKLPQHLGERAALLTLLHRHEHVLHTLGYLGALADLDGRVVLEGALCQTVHVARYRGREEQRLALLGQRVEDLPHVGREAHVEHPVRLVQHQHFEPGEIRVATTHVVEQASGRGDHDRDTLPQSARLRLHGHAAVDSDGVQFGMAAVGACALQYLFGELARRNQHECPGPWARVLVQPLQDREQKRRRLARPGLGRADQVAALQAHGNRFHLNGSGLCVAPLRDGLQEFGREAQ